MDLKSFSLTKQGASHIKSGKECQDYSGSFKCSRFFAGKDFEYAVALVCDGHGGNDYVRSGKGSKFAVDIAGNMIEKFIKDVNKDTSLAEEFFRKPDEYIRNLEASIISEWTKRIYDDNNRNPFQNDSSELANVSDRARKRYIDGQIESAYGTTLIAVAITNDFWFGIQVGDGCCIAISRESKFDFPIERDEKCFLNATTSLCDSDAILHFHHFCQFSKDAEPPAAVIIGSDGIEDSFGSDENLFHFCKTIMYSFAANDFDAAKKELEDYLPVLSEKGSGDDMSLAAVMDMNAVKELTAVKEYDIEKEESRKECEELKAENSRKDEELLRENKQPVQEQQKNKDFERQPVSEKENSKKKDCRINRIQLENDDLDDSMKQLGQKKRSKGAATEGKLKDGQTGHTCKFGYGKEQIFKGRFWGL